MEEIVYSSNAKLLITGEYLVLKGAEALAAPLKFKQHLSVKSDDAYKPLINWKSKGPDGLVFFEAEFTPDDFIIKSATDKEKADYVRSLLQTARLLNPDFPRENRFHIVEARLDFDINWGLGSSSTLISNLADWAGIDPFVLNRLVSKGSGYDIASANASGPILYKLDNDRPNWEEVDFKPPFRENIYFAYTGAKQNTEESISGFDSDSQFTDEDITYISGISRDIVECSDMDEFGKLIDAHERRMSGILKKPSLRNRGFDDYPGAVKSLGAWGGDFILLTWEGDKQGLTRYLSKRNINIFFSFDDIIL